MMLLLTLGLSSCNPGLFIERLETAKTEYVIPFTGGTAEVDLSHGDWILDRVAVNNIDISADTAEMGVSHYESKFLSFSLSRPGDSRLDLCLERSVDPDTVAIDIFVVNDFQSLRIPIKVGACRGYSFGGIEYGKATEMREFYEVAWTHEIKGKQTWSSDVFNESFCRKIQFLASSVRSDDIPEAMWMEELEKYMESTLCVPIPEPFPASDMSVGLEDDPVEFSYKEKSIRMDIPSGSFEISTRDEDNVVRMYWGCVEYMIPFKVWLTHPEGETLSFSGEMYSKTYDGRWRVEL